MAAAANAVEEKVFAASGTRLMRASRNAERRVGQPSCAPPFAIAARPPAAIVAGREALSATPARRRRALLRRWPPRVAGAPRLPRLASSIDWPR